MWSVVQWVALVPIPIHADYKDNEDSVTSAQTDLWHANTVRLVGSTSSLAFWSLQPGSIPWSGTFFHHMSVNGEWMNTEFWLTA